MSIDSLFNGLQEEHFLYLKGYSIGRDTATGLYKIQKDKGNIYFGERIQKNGYHYLNIVLKMEVKK